MKRLHLKRAGAAIAVFALALTISGLQSARAQDATKILKQMSDFLMTQGSISLTFDSDIEVMLQSCRRFNSRVLVKFNWFAQTNCAQDELAATGP